MISHNVLRTLNRCMYITVNYTVVIHVYPKAFRYKISTVLSQKPVPIYILQKQSKVSCELQYTLHAHTTHSTIDLLGDSSSYLLVLQVRHTEGHFVQQIMILLWIELADREFFHQLFLIQCLDEPQCPVQSIREQQKNNCNVIMEHTQS